MKKTVVALFGLAMLSGCAGYYDYYKGGVRYTQDGEDCIFYAAERGRHYSEDIAPQCAVICMCVIMPVLHQPPRVRFWFQPQLLQKKQPVINAISAQIKKDMYL